MMFSLEAHFLKGARFPPSMPGSACEHVFVILIDDTNGEKFLEFLNQGLFPNLKKHVLDRGSFCQHSICQFPSSSANGHTTLATGNFASRTGLINALWWDTTRQDVKAPIPCKIDAINVSTLPMCDKVIKAKTMFEYLPSKDSMSFSTIKRGAGFRFFEFHNLLKYIGFFLKLMIKGVANVTNQGGKFESLILMVFKNFVKGLGKKGKPPALTFLSFLPTDTEAHKHGFDSEQYKEAVQLVDSLVSMLVNGFDEHGRHVLGLKDIGAYDRTAIVLVADHGSAPFEHEKMLDIVKHLKEDFPWNCYSVPVLAKGEKHDNWDALTYEDGDEAPLYLRGNDGRSLRWITAAQLEGYQLHDTLVDFKKYFLSFDGVARIYHMTDPNTILVHSKDGIARFSRQNSVDHERFYNYEVLEGDDPLSYTTDAVCLIDGQYHSNLEWLNKTYLATYPNVPDHMFGYFDSDFAPTLVAVVSTGWAFYHPEDPEEQAMIYVNMHGGEARCKVTTPLVLGGAGVKRGVELDVCQNVDMVPTVLKLLGISFKPGDFHGRPLDELLDIA